MRNDRRKSAEEKKLLGARCDGIARVVGSPEEFAASEEAQSWDGDTSTKYLRDGGLKLPKVMHAMLCQKIKKYNLGMVRSNQIEIIGLLHSGKIFFY
jgi:hypothetical protein